MEVRKWMGIFNILEYYYYIILLLRDGKRQEDGVRGNGRVAVMGGVEVRRCMGGVREVFGRSFQYTGILLLYYPIIT